MVFKPATPGFIVTLTATILLAVVSFNVPLLKSVFFLKATLSAEGVDGTITFGTLGYCIALSNGTTCSKASVGYEFNPNQLLGDDISFLQIPTVVVKWITYALVLHIVALVLAAISAVFGLLAHIREMSMTCCSTCVSGFAAAVALVAFIFDLVLFFVAKSRIDDVDGAVATIGSAIWLTLAAWILLFLSGCFYTLGRCCINSRARGSRDKEDNTWNPLGTNNNNNNYAEQMRLDAVKAEADRKARQKQGEVGLPAFEEHDASQPLNSGNDAQYLEDDEGEPYRDHRALGAGAVGAGVGAGAAAYARRQGSGRSPAEYRGGYAQAPPGTRAVDEYYSPTRQEPSTGYPPQPSYLQTNVQPQQTSNYSRSNYAPSTHSATPDAHNQYLSTTGQTGHGQYPSSQDYGHTAGGTTYHSAASHQQYPTNYSRQADAYNQPQPAFDSDAYNSSGVMAALGNSNSPAPYGSSTAQPQVPHTQSYGSSNYYTPPTTSQPERSYTLGGGGYGANVVPALQSEAQDTSYFPRSQTTQNYPHSPSPVNTNVAAIPGPTSPRGPRGPRGARSPVYEHEDAITEDSPPGYDAGPAQDPGVWGEKR